VEALIDRMRAENTTQRRAEHSRLEPLSVLDVNWLATAAVWPPWNTVEGPQARSDDPQDYYVDRFTAGLTPTEADRMRAIELLFPHLESFVRAGPAPGRSSLRDLSQAVLRARRALDCALPISYRPEMWTQDGAGGLWRKAR
jgi:hypothetical protein